MASVESVMSSRGEVMQMLSWFLVAALGIFSVGCTNWPPDEIVAVSSAAGTGAPGESGAQADVLKGMYGISVFRDCILVLTFDGSNYTVTDACPDGHGGLLVQRSRGSYQIVGDVIRETPDPTEACPVALTTTANGETPHFLVTDEHLQLTFASGTKATMARLKEDPSRSAPNREGCYGTRMVTATFHAN